jgi:hypothetical protein
VSAHPRDMLLGDHWDPDKPTILGLLFHLWPFIADDDEHVAFVKKLFSLGPNCAVDCQNVGMEIVSDEPRIKILGFSPTRVEVSLDSSVLAVEQVPVDPVSESRN